jgi:hypothetical protein
MDTPSALIGRVAAREPDREHLRVKRAGGRLDLSARLALGEPIDTAPLLDELHQLRALIAAGPPELAVRYLVEGGPRSGVAGMPPPVLTEVAVQQTGASAVRSRSFRCTPLVTWVIGTASTGRSGHSTCHISRATLPWRRLTAFAATHP